MLPLKQAGHHPRGHPPPRAQRAGLGQRACTTTSGNPNAHSLQSLGRPAELSERTWSSMVLTPSGPRASMAWLMRSVLPQLSMRKPRSWLNLSVAARASSLRKELKQHSGLWGRDPDTCERDCVRTLPANLPLLNKTWHRCTRLACGMRTE